MLPAPSIAEIAATLAESEFGAIPLINLERAAIINAVHDCNGNRTHAAQKLGVSVRTIQRKLKSASLAASADTKSVAGETSRAASVDCPESLEALTFDELKLLHDEALQRLQLITNDSREWTHRFRLADTAASKLSCWESYLQATSSWQAVYDSLAAIDAAITKSLRRMLQDGRM